MKIYARQDPLRLEILIVLLILIFSLGVRLFLADMVYFDSDEAIQGLMAKHIAEGRELPIMEYGSSHHGAFASYLIALLYLIKNAPLSVSNLRLYAVVLWIASAIPLYLAARRRLGRLPAAFCLLFYCLPPVSVMDFSVKAWPGQAEAQFIIALLLYGLLVIQPTCSSPKRFYFLCGFGMSFLVGLTPAAIPGLICIAFFLTLRAKQLDHSLKTASFFFLFGVLLACIPTFAYCIQHQDKTLVQFILKTVPHQLSISENLQNLFIAGCANLLGLHTPSCASKWHLFSGLILYALLLTGGVKTWRTIMNPMRGSHFLLFSAAYILLYTILLLMPRWNQSLTVSPRYLFPALPILTLLCSAAFAYRPPRFLYGKIFILLCFGVWLLIPNLERMIWDEISLDRKLVHEIQSRGIHYLLTDYWESYKIVFLSNEDILASPQAGPIVVDRYPKYTDAIYASPSPSYLLIPSQYKRFKTVEHLEHFLNQNSISYKKDVLNGRVLIWDLSQKVLPNETRMLRFGDAR